MTDTAAPAAHLRPVPDLDDDTEAAAERGQRELNALHEVQATARQNLAAAKAAERTAPRADRAAAREARKQAEQRVKLAERAVHKAERD
ncbi:hypothetical protein ACIOML_23730 [Streptomyces anulatus]